jgi:hypothetical protein
MLLSGAVLPAFLIPAGRNREVAASIAEEERPPGCEVNNSV